MISLKNKVALVTGGSRGIGAAVSLKLAEAGCDIIVNYRQDHVAADRTVTRIKKRSVRAGAIAADIADYDRVVAMVAEGIGNFDHIDILVNGAGIWEHDPIGDLTPERLAKTLDTNLLGNFHTIMAVVPHMIRQRSGTIINIASTAGQRGESFHSPYAASKGGLISLTKSLAVELAPHNIRVNGVAPGWVATDMSRQALAGKSGRKVTEQIPLGRVAGPDEIAGPVLFLASEMASFITGEILNVNGGAVLCG